MGCLTWVLRLVTLAAVCVGLLVGAVWMAGTVHPSMVLTPALATATPASATPAPAGTAQPGSQAAAETARQKLAHAVATSRAAPPGSHRPISVTLTEAEVNALVVPELASDSRFPLQQPSVVLQPGKTLLEGQMSFGPTTVPVVAVTTISMDGSIPRLVLQSVTAAGIAAPDQLVQQLGAQINANAQLSPSDLPFTVQRIVVGDHSVTVAGVTK